MGSYGSGRYYRGYVKTKVEDCHKVDANDYARWNYLGQAPIGAEPGGPGQAGKPDHAGPY